MKSCSAISILVFTLFFLIIQVLLEAMSWQSLLIWLGVSVIFLLLENRKNL